MLLYLRMQVKKVLLILKHETLEGKLIWLKVKYSLRVKPAVTLEGNTVIKTELSQCLGLLEEARAS